MMTFFANNMQNAKIKKKKKVQSVKAENNNAAARQNIQCS